MKTYTIQSKEKVWKDEAGNSIPATHIKPVEKVNEKVTGSIVTKALKVSEQLSQLKSHISKLVDEAFETFRKSYEGKKEDFKGNITLFNFDRTIKVEVRVTDAIQFDDMTISAAKAKLDEFLRDGIETKDAVIKEMVLDAFSTARGKLDVKKILGLKRYSDRIKDGRYSEAMSLIDQAIRRPNSATYYRVWVKSSQGHYESIPLALADV
jgi:galactose mutarotase-like enzyme